MEGSRQPAQGGDSPPEKQSEMTPPQPPGKEQPTVPNDFFWPEQADQADRRAAATGAAADPGRTARTRGDGRSHTSPGETDTTESERAAELDEEDIAELKTDNEKLLARQEKQRKLALDKEKQLADQEADKRKYVGSDAAHATQSKYTHDYDPPVEQDPTIHDTPDKPVEPSSTFGASEGDRLPEDIPDGTATA